MECVVQFVRSMACLKDDASIGLLGRIVDGMYRIDEVAAHGGFSVVYRAWHLGLQEPFAVKCLVVPPNIGEVAERVVTARFWREGLVLYKVAHRGNLRMYGSGSTRAAPTGAIAPYLVFEWLDGRTLADEIHPKGGTCTSRPLPKAIELLDGAVEGLAHAHMRGVVHRDVKPRNVMCLAYPESLGFQTKLLDFGVAKVIDESGLEVGPQPTTARGVVTLSMPYSAPEQFDPTIGGIGPWTDVYSLALTLLEATAGKRVIRADDPPAYAARALDPRRRPMPWTVGVMCGDTVNEVFARALTVDPSRRWADAGVFWGALKHALASDAARDEETTAIPVPLSSESHAVGEPDTVRMPFSRTG